MNADLPSSWSREYDPYGDTAQVYIDSKLLPAMIFHFTVKASGCDCDPVM